MRSHPEPIKTVKVPWNWRLFILACYMVMWGILWWDYYSLESQEAVDFGWRLFLSVGALLVIGWSFQRVDIYPRRVRVFNVYRSIWVDRADIREVVRKGGNARLMVDGRKRGIILPWRKGFLLEEVIDTLEVPYRNENKTPDRDGTNAGGTYTS